MRTVQERLTARLGPPNKNGCREIDGWKTEKGYGRIEVEGKIERAHRVAWQIAYGPIPEGMLVLHTCDNPPCCEPSHLFLGDHTDNIRDAMSKDRRPKGETHHKSKLSEMEIVTIRSDYQPNIVGFKQLSHKYKVAWTTIRDIVRRKTWKHVK